MLAGRPHPILGRSRRPPLRAAGIPAAPHKGHHQSNDTGDEVKRGAESLATLGAVVRA